MIEEDGAIWYLYGEDDSSDEGWSARFPTLAEVGQPFVPIFEAEIKRRGLTIQYGRDIDSAPYVQDFMQRQATSEGLPG